MRNDDGMAALGSGHHVIDGKHAYRIGQRRGLACEETNSQAVHTPLESDFPQLRERATIGRPKDSRQRRTQIRDHFNDGSQGCDLVVSRRQLGVVLGGRADGINRVWNHHRVAQAEPALVKGVSLQMPHVFGMIFAVHSVARSRRLGQRGSSP